MINTAINLYFRWRDTCEKYLILLTSSITKTVETDYSICAGNNTGLPN